MLVAVKARWASVWQATGEVLANVDPEEFDIKIIDVDSDRQAAYQLGVEIIPTVIVYNDGKEVARLPNLMNSDQLSEAIADSIAE